VVETGGSKIGEGTLRSVLAATYPHLSAVDLSTSRIAGGAVGALMGHLADPDFLAAMNLILADDNDVSQRIARTSAMAVALKLSPARLHADREGKYWERILQTIGAILGSDNTDLVSNGIRACAHLFSFCVKSGEPLPSNLIRPFVKTINSSSTEVKTLVAQASQVFARRILPTNVPKEIARYLIPALVNGAQEKDLGVRTSCEMALSWILRLDEEDKKTNLLEHLDPGAETTVNCLSEVMKKLRIDTRTQLEEAREPDIDDTTLI